MRCCSKSTTWRASLALAVTASCATHVAAQDVSSAVRDAIVASVSARMRVEHVQADAITWEIGNAAAGLEARPEPGARLKRPARFTLLANGRPVGYAVATISVSGLIVRATRDLSRGVINDGDVVSESGDPGSVPIAALPRLADVAHATLARPVAARETLTFTALRRRQPVQSGDRIEVRATIGPVDAVGFGVALQGGEIGDVIRVVNPESRRELRARVVARLKVEVSDER